MRRRRSGLEWRGAQDAVRAVDEEVRLHVELRKQQLVAEGWSPAAAQQEAERLFARGPATVRALYSLAKGRNRRMRMRERLESWLQDVRYAARSLARDRLLALFVVLVLALGMGVNVTAFSLLDRLLLRDPAHVQAPRELVRLYGTVQLASGDQTSSWIPWPVYQQLHANMGTFTGMGGYRVVPELVGRGASARTLRVGQVTGSFMPLLGVPPLRGRLFRADEDEAGAGKLAVVSVEYWRSELGGALDVTGRTVMVGDDAYTIIGVAPAGFAGTELRRVDVWRLIDTRRAGTMNWNIVGRLRPGLSRPAVSADAQAVFDRTRAAAPKWYQEAKLFAAPIRYDQNGHEPFEATMARWLAVVSAVILLVALANVINLLLVRVARRRQELAVRVALGSGRARVVRLLALEGMLLALAAGVASLWVARLTEPVVQRALLADEATWRFSLADARVLRSALAVALLTALLTGIVPALRAGGVGLADALRSGGRGGVGGNTRVRSALTVIQAALSVVLLAGAGLFLHSLARVRALDLGVDPDRVVTASVQLPRLTTLTSHAISNYMDNELAIFRHLVEVVRRLPGVQHAAIAIGLPLDGGSFSAGVHVPGLDSIPVMPGGGPFASTVGTDYFETAGTRLLRGRAFTDDDRAGTEPVLIVSETMAKTLWPGQDAIGQCARIGPADAPCRRIVGIAQDVHRTGLRERPSMQYYMALGQQHLFGGATLLVRPDANAPVNWPALRQAVVASDPAIRAVELQWMRDQLSGEMRPLRLGMVTFGLSGALALLVATLGLYSLMAYLVAWRTREIGVRMAIGASDAQISRMVIGSGAGLALLGVCLGLLLTGVAGRWVAPYLFQTDPVDPTVYGGVALLLLLVAGLAGWLPARRALRISPTEALRAE